MSGKQRNGEPLDLITLDRLDDDLIVAEVQGRAISTWAYKFTQDGQEITGLSIAGVEQACRASGRHGEAIRILKHEWRETEDAYYGIVEAGRYLLSSDGREVLIDTAIGSKHEAKLKWSKKRNGWYEDPFAFEKAISKAARNAKAKLLDDQVKSEIVAAALKQGRTQAVSPRQVKQARRETTKEESPPPRDKVKDDEARRRFFATAGEMELLTSDAIHAKLGLDCKGQGNHDDDDPEACHSLSARVDVLSNDGRGRAAAWDAMTKALKGEVPRGFKG